MRKIIFLPILIFLIFAVVLYGLIPSFSKTAALSGDLKKQTANLQQIKNYFVNLREIASQIEQNQEIFINIEKALPSEFSAPSLMNFFQTTAAESGLLLSNFNYGEAVNEQESNNIQTTILGPKVKPTVFKLTMKGRLTSFLSFIKSLETSSRLLEVNSISFQTDKTETDKTNNSQVENDNEQAGGGIIQFDVSIKVYSY